MKKQPQIITVIVSISLISIFAMQYYWLNGFYHSMVIKTENAINNSIRNADNAELFYRLQTIKHNHLKSKGYATYASNLDYIDNNEIATSAYLDVNGDTLVSISNIRTRISKVSNKNKRVLLCDTGKIAPRKDNASNKEEYKNVKIEQLMQEMQRGMNFAANKMGIRVDIRRFDRLLSKELKSNKINTKHYTEIVNVTRNKVIATTIPKDMNINKDNWEMHKMIFDDVSDLLEYHIYTEKTNSIVQKEMIMIVVSSILVFLLLSGAFIYLIYIICHQKSLDEMKDDFTNNITHELKTPIAVAYAANDAMMNFSKDASSSKANKYHTIVKDQLKHLTGLVEQILSMNMEQRKSFRLSKEEIELKPLIEELITKHSLKTENKTSFEFNITPDNLTVYADRTHLYNIISNLIDNASKYSTEKAQVTIKAYKQDNKVYISVADKGIGISQDGMKHIFDKFYRVPQGNLHNVSGYGLGLYYVKTMMDYHHATIKVSSCLGKGSSFTLIF